jgi:Dolichyl-phosphate-mannose-protein mannosyltransferase
LQLLLIILGGLVPLAVAYSLGKLCFRRAPDVIALGAGAVIESLLIFGLLSAGVARPQAFAVLGIIGLLPLAWLRPHLRTPMPRGLIVIIFAAYGALYLINALAPEIQPDGMYYHLGLVAEYARLGAFPHRVGFFEMIPQGMEMLFLFAFVIGKHSSAKLVEFGFLLATIPLMLDLGRRMRLPDRVSAAAAVLYFCAPVVGISGTSTYNDAALVFFTLATLLALLLWKQENHNGYLLAAGLLAGFCYSIKMSGLLVPFLAVGFVLYSRRLRPALVVLAMALLPIVPWLLRNTLMTGDPFAPLANTIFPNPYFHLPMEQSLIAYWKHYPGFSFHSAPWELTVGDKLQGNFGPVFLFVPVALLALRSVVGRWTWLAAVLLAIPWLSNVGARFLMPSIPFFALALAMSLDSLARPLLWACIAIHAVTCEPTVALKYQTLAAWKLPPLPWRAALRIEPEESYLSRTVWAYPVLKLLRENTRPNETTFALLSLPTAYNDRRVVDFWETALADRVMDALGVAYWRFELRGEWPSQFFKGLRFRLASPPIPNEWDVSEIRLYSGSDRVGNSRQWMPNAWPNPWEASLAFDDNYASRWRTFAPMRPGMFMEVLFDQPLSLTSAVVTSHTPAFGKLPLEFYGLGTDGAWKLLSANAPPVIRGKEDHHAAALRYIKRCGIDYILAPESTAGVWQLGKQLIEEKQQWGFEDVAQYGPVHLLHLPD